MKKFRITYDSGFEIVEFHNMAALMRFMLKRYRRTKYTTSLPIKIEEIR